MENIIFDDWNLEKKRIQAFEEVTIFPKEGDVYSCALGMNVGSEQNGQGPHFLRPVLVFKKFTNKLFWAIPLTSKEKQLDFCLKLKDYNGQPSVAILAQLRLVSFKRMIGKLYRVSHEEFLEVQDAMIAMIKG